MNVDWAHGRRAEVAAGVAADPRFPWLPNIADERLVLAQLWAAFGRRAEADGCEVFNVWYIPRKSLQVVYQLRTTRPTLFGVRFLPGLATADVNLPEWRAVAWQFPDDPDLPGLTHLLASTPCGKVLSYLPGARCTILGQGIVGKLDRAGGADRVHARLSRLWQIGARRYRMPRPLAVDPSAEMRWEEAVDGQRLDAFLGQGSTAALLKPVVAAAAELHAVPLQGLPEVSPAGLLRRIERKVLPRVAATLPDLAPEAEAWFAALDRHASRLPKRPLTTVHCDLHTANVLLDGGTPVLVDLDSLARGDAALDLALLGSRVLLLALQRGEGLAEGAQAVAWLPEAYAAAGGRPIPDATFAWYMSAMLVGRQIRTAIRHRAPDLGIMAPTLLTWARQTLDRGRFAGPICHSHAEPTETQ